MGIAYRSVLKDIGTGGISVDSVTITSYPDTTIYFAGDKLDLSGLVVYAEIGSLSGDVTNDCTFTPANGDILTASTNKITVKYGNEKLDIPITIVMPTAITITSQPTKTTYKTDEPLDFTGLVVTASNSEAGLSANITSACTFNPAEGTTLDEEKTYTISVSYGSLNTSFDVLCQNLPAWDERGLNYNSWETIQDYIKAGLFNTVASIGQTKSFVINGKTYNAEVVSINDGTGLAGQWYPNKTVDFIVKELYTTTYRINPTQKNAGGFPASEIKGTLDNTIYPLLPTDLKSVIIEKSHVYEAGNKTSSGWNHVEQTLATKLWLPSYYEVMGNNQATYLAGETAYNNKPYTIASKLKQRNGENYWWWFCSPNTQGEYTFWIITNNGRADYVGATDQMGVPICFRIG